MIEPACTENRVTRDYGKSLGLLGNIEKLDEILLRIELLLQMHLGEKLVEVKVTAKKPVKHPGIKAGNPLPDNGTCKHYKKSYRWLR